MKTKLFDVFTGEEEVEVNFDKFVAKKLPRFRSDKIVKLESGKPENGESILVLERGELVNGIYLAGGTNGIYWFPDWVCYRSVHKTDGWCRWTQFCR